MRTAFNFFFFLLISLISLSISAISSGFITNHSTACLFVNRDWSQILCLLIYLYIIFCH